MVQKSSLLFLSLVSFPAWGQTPKAPEPVEKNHDHHHHHHHESTANPALTLDNGKKWASDAPLRDGMTKILAIVQQSQKSLRDKTAKPDVAQAAAHQIQAEVQKIFQNCKLTPKADAALHVILADIIGKVEKLKGQNPQPQETFAQIGKDLDLYGQYFDHPQWDASKVR